MNVTPSNIIVLKKEIAKQRYAKKCDALVEDIVMQMFRPRIATSCWVIYFVNINQRLRDAGFTDVGDLSRFVHHHIVQLFPQWRVRILDGYHQPLHVKLFEKTIESDDDVTDDATA